MIVATATATNAITLGDEAIAVSAKSERYRELDHHRNISPESGIQRLFCFQYSTVNKMLIHGI